MLKTNALKIALIYAVISLLWIFFSDRLLKLLFEETVKLTLFQTIKGSFFVAATALLIFYLVRREIRRKDNLIKLLDESEQWYKTLVKNIPRTDLYLFDREQAIISATGSNLASEGIAANHIKGLPPQQIPLPSQLRKFLALHFDAILSGNEVTEEIRLKNKWYELRGQPLHDKNNTIYGGIAALINITGYKELILNYEEKNKEYEALYEEYLTTNEELRELNEHLRQANEQLKISEERYRAFISQSSEGIYRMNLTEPMAVDMPLEQQVQHLYHKSLLKECNNAFRDMYGFQDLEEIKDKTLADFHGGDNHPENRKMMYRFLQNNFRITGEVSSEQDANGNPRYFSNNVIGIIENGYLTHFWGTQTDITERIHAYQQMRLAQKHAEDNQQKYKSLFNNLNDAALLFTCQSSDQPGQIIEANKMAGQLLGETPEALKGRTISSLPFKQKSPFSKKQLKKLHQDKLLRQETIISDSKGNAVEVEVSSISFTFRKSKFILMLIRDISERKRTEQKLRDAYQFTQNILNNVPMGIAVYAKDYRIITWNKTMEQYTGYGQETVGKTPDEIFTESVALIKNNLQKAFAGKNTKTEDYQLKNGQWFTTRFSPNYAQDGTITSVNTITADITGRKQTEEALIKAKEKAEESDRLKTSFLSNMSHEIRTPLNAIIGFSDLLNREDFDQNVRDEYLEIIKRSGDQLLHIINNILDVSLIETGQITLQEKPFHLNELLDEVLIELRKQIAQKNKPINTQAQYHFSANQDKIIGDRERIMQVLTKLVHNAENFTQQGIIEIGYTYRHPHIAFYISDTGEGIPQHEQEVIFERFIQLDKEKTTVSSGTGLGLTIARGLVKLMGGSISLTSTAGEGATFQFTIPYKPDSKFKV